ncbi:MAG: CRISPR-associated helicase Cas3' [Hyphomonas sp.]|nr:CRISPR-associated helicase Cas3' [Hyphomonas sp.]
MYYARTTDDSTKSNWQLLDQHLAGTATLAGSYGRPLGIEHAAFQSGLLHDLGKYTAAFQRRLAGSPEQVEHSSAGAWWAWNNASPGTLVFRQLIAHAIAGHHAGLPDRTGEIGAGSSLEDRLSRFDPSDLDPVWQSEICPDLGNVTPSMNPLPDAAALPFRLAFLGRMLFSCLVDADRKDAEAFCVRSGSRAADRSWPQLQEILDDAISAFDARIANFKTDSPVNALRATILKHTRSQAKRKPGLFTFTVPTGGGKTLASLGFALEHARAHRLRRIIYVAPFTAIIDQTAAIYRDILGEACVLEHHSAVENDAAQSADENENNRRVRHAMQDWAAPIIVTTNVQLFESLFAAKPSKCQKLHNIAQSVIVLDEAQTLPRHLLAACMRAIDELARNYGCTVILCTATQPALDVRNFAWPTSERQARLGLELEGRELAPDPAGLARALRRVTLLFAGPRTNDDLITELRNHKQGLIIVNSRRHALAIYREARSAGLESLVHLSTRQCGLDRKSVLADVRGRLLGNEPCRVIATSLVEAGVDLDFPRVWRAAAGLDQIAQAAGRCNREGKRLAEDSIVTVFEATDFPAPAEIRNLTGDLSRILGKHPDLFAPSAMEDYFGEVYWRVGPEGLDRDGILGLLQAMDRTGVHFAYRTAAEKFRMIEDGMASVIIPRDERSACAIQDLGKDWISSGGLARDLQPYIVQVPPRARARLIANGRASFGNPSLRGDQFCVLTDPDLYTPETGLLWEDADFLSTESMMWS